ncbi:MAG: polysaccharide deacetylase family protein [Rhodothermales bacterium]|nr:polysaccharide deacetylase family protein [Rhodothermales bacterium]
MRWLAKGSPLRTWVKGRVADSARVLGTLTHVDTDEPAVALTFDDGPHPEHTPRILDLLAERGARATFFMVGKAARRHPEIAARAVAEGHAVANHGWDHPSFPLLSARGRRLQVAWTQDALPDGASRLFRPPWGHQSLASRLTLWRLGFPVVAWSVMAEDWADDPAPVLAERLRAGLRPGAIALLHDALWATDDPRHRDRAATVAATATLLAEEGDRFRFVTVPELVRLGRPRYWHWYKPPDLEWLRRQV